MKYIILDIEASGLDGFPIEIGWCDQDGKTESHLIRPAPSWTDWDERAELIHGISRERLAVDGEPHEAVARRVADLLVWCGVERHIVASDNPAYDAPWIRMLIVAAGLRDRVMLVDVEELHAVAVEPLFADMPEDWNPGYRSALERCRAKAAGIIQAAKGETRGLHRHRAADDVRRQWKIIESIVARVAEEIGR
jgi:hypothetical protein